MTRDVFFEQSIMNSGEIVNGVTMLGSEVFVYAEDVLYNVYINDLYDNLSQEDKDKVLFVCKRSKDEDLEQSNDDELSKGFEYQGNKFRINENNLPYYSNLIIADDKGLLPAGFKFSGIGGDFIILNNSTDVNNFYLAAFGSFMAKRNHTDTKISLVNQATTIDEVLSIEY